MSKIQLQKHKKIGEIKINKKSIKDLAKIRSYDIENLIREIKDFELELPSILNTKNDCEQFIYYSKLFNRDCYRLIHLMPISDIDNNYYDYLELLENYFKKQYKKLIKKYQNLSPTVPKFKKHIKFDYIDDDDKICKVIILENTKLLIIDNFAIKFIDNQLFEKIKLYLTKNYPKNIIDSLDITENELY